MKRASPKDSRCHFLLISKLFTHFFFLQKKWWGHISVCFGRKAVWEESLLANWWMFSFFFCFFFFLSCPILPFVDGRCVWKHLCNSLLSVDRCQFCINIRYYIEEKNLQFAIRPVIITAADRTSTILYSTVSFRNIEDTGYYCLDYDLNDHYHFSHEVFYSFLF